MPRTLVISSDRVVELAEARASAEGKTVERVIEEALEASKGVIERARSTAPVRDEAEVRERLAEVQRLTAEIQQYVLPGTKGGADPESERQAKLTLILERARALRATLPADVTSDHSYLYDEHGLPR
jgi:hypothetical protein